MYTGVAGIALFLLELYGATGEIKYLNASEESMKWVDNSCKKNPMGSYAFITGRIGVSFSMLRMYEVTGRKEYIKKALRIAKKCPIPAAMGADDLINGSAGIILALLHLHAATDEEWLLEKIDAYINHLIKKVNAGKKGLYWDRIPGYIKGLCGFSHGAAGVGYVFLELGHYFNNPAFYWIAEQAFLYESVYFNKKLGNWSDLRKFKDTDEDFKKQETAFVEGDLNFFLIRGDMNAWCHGAAGIGLSRLRAYELLKNRLYKRDIDFAIRKTIYTDVDQNNTSRSYIYCHGKGGNADLFLEAYKMFKNDEYLKNSEIVALEALKSKKETGVYNSGFGYASAIGKEDRSLFMGNAGIGYFYLKLLNPLDIPSVLYPRLDSVFKGKITKSIYPNIKISADEIKKRVTEKFFGRTISIAEKIIPDEIKRYFSSARPNRKNENNEFSKFIKKKSFGLSLNEKKLILDVFSFESAIFNMDSSIPSNAYLDIKSIVLSKKAKELTALDNDAFSGLELQLDPAVKLKFTKWNWERNGENSIFSNFKNQPSQNISLLKPEAGGIAETHISPVVYNIITSFEKKNSVGNVINEILENFDGVDETVRETIVKAVQEQIRQLINYGVLIQDIFSYSK